MALEQEPWYELATDHIQQGDFVSDLRIYAQDNPRGEADAEGFITAEGRVETIPLSVIMSQSCDLLLDRGDTHAVLCPVLSVESLVAQYDRQRVGDWWEQARKGNAVNYHPLASCTLPTRERGEALVDFRRIFEVELGPLVAWAESNRPIVRLNSPYREKLAQAFARKIMRIGLPLEVPEWADVANRLTM